MEEIARFQGRVAMRLLVWSVPSIIIGIVLVLTDAPIIRGIGLQAVIWGGIDAGLGVFGYLRARGRVGRYPDEIQEVREARAFRRILLFNAVLDPFYFAGGLALLVVLGADPFLAGNGIGIMIQALFLLVFDVAHARMLPSEVPAWYSPQS